MEIIQVYAHAYVNAMYRIGLIVDHLGWHTSESLLEMDQLSMLLATLEELKNMCEQGELPVTELAVGVVLFALKEKRRVDNAAWKMMLEKVQDRIPDELSTKLFLQIPHSKKAYFEKPLKDWESIVKRFPDCIRDVEEMNRCFALSRYPASMFHAMHVAEWGAIDLGGHIGVTDPVKGWGATTKKLEALVKEGRAKFPLSDVTFDFVEQINQEAGTMKMAWRHKIDHAANHLTIVPSAEFTPDIAEHIIKSVRVFMVRIAEGTKKP